MKVTSTSLVAAFCWNKFRIKMTFIAAGYSAFKQKLEKVVAVVSNIILLIVCWTSEAQRSD